MALVGLAAMIGCGSATKGRPATAKVTGTVTHNGKALDGASVVFVPVDQAGFSAVGVTDASGNYTVNTMGDPGAVPGEYLVKVMKSTAAPSGGSGASESEYKPPDANAPPPLPKSLLPAKYASETQSGLKATVKKGEENKINFDLK